MHMLIMKYFVCLSNNHYKKGQKFYVQAHSKGILLNKIIVSNKAIQDKSTLLQVEEKLQCI